MMEVGEKAVGAMQAYLRLKRYILPSGIARKALQAALPFIALPSAARELALEEGFRKGTEAAAKLIECGCKDLLYGKGECQFPGNCSLEDAAAIRSLSSPEHADAGKVEGDGWGPITDGLNAIGFEIGGGYVLKLSYDSLDQYEAARTAIRSAIPSAPASEGEE
ncbi:hypothetical protein [Brucella anthropi]|uniref:hypothetical protein n=1 Tax=Brucella anthropi TaxID=529 RepID=UPI00244A669E|nr:hypothetical protein [Brucella anthropi]MDH0369052.1 hypothetical protein [Brucella anthropi]